MSAKHGPRSRRRRTGRRTRWYLFVIVAVLLVAAGVIVYSLTTHSRTKPIILYVNQGNGVVNGSNFVGMLNFTLSHGFNMVFFQVYRQGDLLFSTSQLQTFIEQAHARSLKIFFSLYITNSSQPLPTSIYNLGEDGISLDMSTVGPSSQQAYLTNLVTSYHGESAVTTTDMTSQLKPSLLVLETYGTAYQQFIKPGIVASVGVFATANAQDYESQLQYAVQNSDGVMVFDYVGLLKHGY